MENKEIVYYQMWSREDQSAFEEKYEVNNRINDRANEYLFAVNIEENNKMFLDELGKKIIKGYEELGAWLRGLIVSYVERRRSKENGDTEYSLSYYTEWIDNTLCIIQGRDYNLVEKWCNEYRQCIIESKQN
jgi:hypothetical protein